jgi:hypothetical protein
MMKRSAWTFGRTSLAYHALGDYAMSCRTMSTLTAAVIVLGFVAVASSQPGGPQTELPAIPGGNASSSDAPAMDAERAQIWNSPTMLRARAWVQEYCQRSARISPAEAQQYMTELSNLTPRQMKLWLLKFEAEEEMIRGQQAAFSRSRQAGVETAMGFNRQEQREFAQVNRDQTAAAQGAERSLSAEEGLAAERSLQNAQSRDDFDQALETQPMYVGGYPPYGYAPLLGSGEFHVHYHVHR